jgi:hypothetical protein
VGAKKAWYWPAHNSVKVMKTRLSSSSLLVVRDMTVRIAFRTFALIPATSSGMTVTAHDRAFPVAVSIRWVTVIGPSVRSRVLTNDRG